MRHQPSKTGPFGIGALIHVIHVSADIRELNAWYEDVFGGLVFLGLDEPTYLAEEKRWASLLMISDYCVETVAPEIPVDDRTAFGRFYGRYGERLHSIGFVSDDVVALAEDLTDRGIRCGLQQANDRTWFFPRPRDIGGLIIEFIDDLVAEDPRLREEWSSLQRLWAAHPLGIEGLAYVTVGTRSRLATQEIFTGLWSAQLFGETSDSTPGAKSSWLSVGDIVVELAEPSDSTADVADYVAASDNAVYSVTFRVKDLDSVQAYLASKSIKTERIGDLVRTAPEDCHGARYQFTTSGAPI
ncbi:hypothetical protein [Mycobacterium sp. EPa45]|uniref:hypothetical protein n=1 Tax=Mycobacterium sp. EPa45 TaxID=1545728 RepID=UPI0006422E78|nr:hypothetical protein [Mycobacterium sp. EPa45]AKK25479.1 hypothetical protein AB431_00725 [Mycobacterium sp. EPa45]